MRMAVATLFVALLLAVSSTAVFPAVDAASRIDSVTSSWSPCSSKDYDVTIENVVITPDPVVSGQVATFSIPAYTSKKVDGGSCVVTVSFHGIRVYTERDDLCSKAPCPIDGNFTLENAEALPSFTPPGSYKLKFQVLSSSGQELACASINFNIVWWGKPAMEEVIESAKAEASRKMGQGGFNLLPAL